MSRAILPIFLIVLIDVVGLTIILPLLPFYAQHFGAGPVTVGALIASYSVCQLLAGPTLGRLSDRFGRKPLLIISQLGTCLSFLMLAHAESLAMIFAARILDGLTAGNISLAQASISDVSAPGDRARSFGVVGIAFGVGFFVGPALSSLFVGEGLHAPMYVAAALSATSMIATILLLPSHTHQVLATSRRLFDLDYFWSILRRQELAPSIAAFFCFIFAFSTFTSGFAMFAERRFGDAQHAVGPVQVAWAFAYSGLLGIIVQGGLIGRLVRCFGERRLAIYGFAMAACGCALLVLIAEISALPPASTLLAISFFSPGTGVVRPSLQSLISRAAGADEQGAALGVNQSMQSIAQILAPLLAGFLIGHGWLWAWPMVGVIALMSGMGMLLRPRLLMATAKT